MERFTATVPEEVETDVLVASKVYLLMSKTYRISRNRRAEWFFSNLNAIISLSPKYKLDEYSQELEVISVIPEDPPPEWNLETSHKFRYQVTPNTIVEVLSRKYRIVYCLDISPSVGSVDVQFGAVMFDGMFEALRNSMEGIMKPFYVPGSTFLFQPRIYVTVLAHAPFLTSVLDQILVQGAILDVTTYKNILLLVFEKLNAIENRVADVAASINTAVERAQDSTSPILGHIFEEDEDGTPLPPSSLAMSPDFGFVDLLRQALIALNLLPENSASGLIIVTDGVLSVPDGGYLDMVLSQLRYNTVSCSFVQLSSPFHPHVCYGLLPYSDLMRFIASATFGAFLIDVPKVDESLAINVYHKSFLLWGFQDNIDSFKNNVFPQAPSKPGEWSVRNKCFTTIRDMPIVKKQQYETALTVDYMKVLSCRLREGFTIKGIVRNENMLEIKLVLPWKFLIQIEYILITPWPAQPKVTCIVSLEGPYDFLHDVTCLAKKPFQSYYRQLMVNRFWASQKQLSESDKLLVHFNSFSSNPNFYNIPDSLKNGLPLFYITSNTSVPVLHSSDVTFPNFSQFWKPVCLLDTNIWQKWMHTHRIGVILEHDHPLPKHLHMPNSSGRFHVIQCRQTMMALNTLLKEWSSFVLVENHSYIKLMYKDQDKLPFSFCIIRVTTKPPCVVLRLAFLVGTPGSYRHKAVSELHENIIGLTFPQRLNEPPKWRVPSGSSALANTRAYKRAWSDMPCCVLLRKPIEKILIRYEQVPRNFFKALLPQHPYNSWTNSRKSNNNQSTFGFRPTYSTPWGSHVKMGPELFNTVARYLHHRRWIWCVQSSPATPFSMECAARILSTITKMRLQEGLRFAYSSAGTVNMVVELDMKNDNFGSPNSEVIEDVEDYERTSCILQYVIFPPVTCLSSLIEDDDDDDDERDSVEEDSELFLVTEIWVEPQCGKIMGSADNSYLSDLEYGEIPDKMFSMDRECISALITFEHLSLMCRNGDVPSANEVPCREHNHPKPIICSDENIKYIPFACELGRVLPKSQQAELLFSMFNQDLSMIHKVDELSTFCDRANLTFYDTWLSNIAQLHDREFFLPSGEHKSVFELITQRKRTLTVYAIPVAQRKDHSKGEETRYPKWKCFLRGIGPSHVILTLLPASYEDLKQLMLSKDALTKEHESHAVHFLPVEDPAEDDSLVHEREVCTPQQLDIESAETADEVVEKLEKDIRPTYLDESSNGRKRSRIKSGGESGPLPKKPLNRKSSLDNLFRLRTDSVDAFWKNRCSKSTNAATEPQDDSDCVTSPKTESENTSDFLFDGQETIRRLFPVNHQPVYGSISLPVYVYDCSLTVLTEHIIFRSVSGQEDFYLDRRIFACKDSKASESSNFEDNEIPSFLRSPLKHISPEPKSEEQELPPTNGDVLKEHCSTLEIAFVKSYVHALFDSLQIGHYIHKLDVQEAMRLCRDSRIEVDLTEYIQTICRHFKDIKLKRCDLEDGSEHRANSPDVLTRCDELKGIHEFIKKRFQSIVLSTFHWVMDCPGIFYFKFDANQMKLGIIPSLGNSSRDVSEYDEVESLSLTVKADSVCSDVLQPACKEDLSQSREEELEETVTDHDFILHTEEEEDHRYNSICPLPLFVYLTCTYKHGNASSSFLIHEIPTCLDEIAETLGQNFSEEDPDEKMELLMEFVFLTVPPEVEDIDYKVVDSTRTYSNSSISPVPTSSAAELNSVTATHAEVEAPNEESPEYPNKHYPHLPSQQFQVVKHTVEDVRWLLRDEITSFRWETDSTLTDHALTLVASHVEKSVGKPGCQLTRVPLDFVNKAYAIGFEKFKERFRNISVDGYGLQEEGAWFYLVNKCGNLDPTSSWTPDCSFSTSGHGALLSESRRNSFQSPAPSDAIADIEDSPNSDIAEAISQRKWRRGSVQEGERSRQPTGEEKVEQGGDLKGNSYLTTPSQRSEVSSVIESVFTNEDGYEGDESESAEDKTREKKEADIRNSKVPPFWMVFKLVSEQVLIYFHCRYNEDDVSVYEYSIRLRERIIKILWELKRIVNQDILLHQLNDTRQCSTLLEPDNESEGQMEFALPLTTLRSYKYAEPDPEALTSDDKTRFRPGNFSCKVVWETKFYLHSRLRTGPGKTLVSRGIQTLQATLIAFEVLNRKNMFVYRDTSGNVFYLRLYRVHPEPQHQENYNVLAESPHELRKVDELLEDNESQTNDKLGTLESPKVTLTESKMEDVVLLRVHGITEAGPEIKEQLVQSLRNKLDDAVLEILSVTLDRNPHCKLTPEDVLFIQKPDTLPDTVLRYRVNSYAAQYLPAFAYYLHQNLLQVFYLPKYTDSKNEHRFQDYSDVKDLSDRRSKTMYLYNQSPGGTGSRGIACAGVSLIDSTGELSLDHSLPHGDSYTESFTPSEFEERLNTEEILDDGSESGLIVELRMWKQGRINLDLLRNYLATAIKHSIWDLTMEFYFLTAPVSSDLSGTDESPISESEPTTPTRKSSHGLDRRSLGRTSVPFILPGMSIGAPGRYRPYIDPKSVGLTRREIGEVGNLHENYGSLMTQWCEFGNKLTVPALRIAPVTLEWKHSLQVVVNEVVKLIEIVVPDQIPRQFLRFGKETQYSADGMKEMCEAAQASLEQSQVEFRILKNNLKRLEIEKEYPAELLSLFNFNEEDEFSPLKKSDECVVVSRNPIHWKACIGGIDPKVYFPESFKSLYKFSPMMSSGFEQPGFSSPCVSLERSTSSSSPKSKPCPTDPTHEAGSLRGPVLIPRQRLLLARITDSEICYFFYNWSKESIDRLLELTRFLTLWINARSSLLSSIYAQKAGLFHNQAISRSQPTRGLSTDVNPFTCGGSEIETILRNQSPPKELSPTRLGAFKKAKSAKSLTPFLECFRNLKHQAVVLQVPDTSTHPLRAHGDQIAHIRLLEKSEIKNSLFQYWLLRGPSASNVIGAEGIQAFKQAARTIQYCLTPILFLPRWRQEVASTRDSMTGTVKKPRLVSDSKRQSFQLKNDSDRSRHASGASQKSLESSKARNRSSIWGLWHYSSAQLSQDSQPSSASQSLANLSMKKPDEKWHSTLCESFIQEYMQYLQTLGFIPIHSRNASKKLLSDEKSEERTRNFSGTSAISSGSSQSGGSAGGMATFTNYARRIRQDSGGDKIYYLQKSLHGGIILFEVGLCEPYFYAKIHALEATRIQSRKTWKNVNNQHVLEFMNQCEKMKVLMHLHSFTYDFHLRSIHSYICGRQLIFRTGFHLTNFLDDFIKYYPKGPNFARNTIHIGLITVQNVSTPSQLLYNYILSNEKLYKMKVIRMSMNQMDRSTDAGEYILVQISSRKVVYKDKDDERQYDEFDLTLMIAHDAPPSTRPYSTDPSVLRLKYYIILTSRRELYPKLIEESGDGKLCIVNAPEPLSLQRELRTYITSSLRNRKPSVDDKRRTDDSTAVDKDGNSDPLNTSTIRNETVHYMGYFSSHEQMMQETVKEQVEWVEAYIREMITQATVDCRRDLLWQRLLVGDEKQKNKKEDLISRETVGALSYWEFIELLELVQIKSLSECDPRLACLLRQPVSFYQGLLKLITQGNKHHHRYYCAPDNSVHQMAIFSPNVHSSVVLLDVNLDKRTSDLRVLFKDLYPQQDLSKPQDLDPEILRLIESVINLCCYCSWANLVHTMT